MKWGIKRFIFGKLIIWYARNSIAPASPSANVHGQSEICVVFSVLRWLYASVIRLLSIKERLAGTWYTSASAIHSIVKLNMGQVEFRMIDN